MLWKGPTLYLAHTAFVRYNVGNNIATISFQKGYAMALTPTDINLIKEALEPRFQAIQGDINNLATACAEQFLAIDDRFAQMDERFEQIDERFEQIDERFEQIESELGIIKDAVTNHSYRLVKLEA
jgi:septal ring factor EnvC (AmiA/AmiB activator)